MQPSQGIKIFNHCPNCRIPEIFFDGTKEFRCQECSFTYFHNTAAAVGVILEYGEQIVLLKRNREPAKGKLDLPGGFVDPGESAEEAVRREVREELYMDLGALKYLSSYSNTYEYKGVTYTTCDLFFSNRIDALPTKFDISEIEQLILMRPSDIPEEHIAFESLKMWLNDFKRGIDSHTG